MYYKRVGSKSTTIELDRFNRLVDHLLSVPKAEIQKREEAYQKASPRSKRDPKPATSPAVRSRVARDSAS